jgi:hypothetical protein
MLQDIRMSIMAAYHYTREKENHLCNNSVDIDSSCDDETTGHVPSEFRFEICSREK